MKVRSKTKKLPVIFVVCKVRAISQGYYNGRIVPVDEEFTYVGGLNRAMGLPQWTEPLEEGFEKIIADAISKHEASEKEKAAAPVVPALVVPALKPMTKAQMIAVIVTIPGNTKQETELARMTVAELKVLLPAASAPALLPNLM